ncbi:MAG: N-acetylmuramoyl-L-alanine amidase [Clostridia bacterium]|nr:N-acetylmuramoyl-L-alanine amidase [Clostridia bacterium]MDD4685909.1 N-acetylmuramoyl-L-alanine amidase [Clostridia bacterium]
MCITLNKKIIVIILIIILLLSLVFALPSAFTSTPSYNYIVLIDAGHGGVDGGAVGRKTGKDENSLNLEYAFTLKEILERFNIKVIMTRTTLNGLYNPFSVNKKKDDMLKRKEIINNSKANLVISIHMNSHSLSSPKGSQVFYKEDDHVSKGLAECIQQIFVQTLPDARVAPSIGDYYILNCTDIPGVIIECGYLSNQQEEMLLLTESHRQLICYSIFIGVLRFLSV